MAVLLVGDLLGWTQPQGIYWLSASLAIALVALMSSGLGVALGAALQRMHTTIAIANSGSIYLFFLAGGIGVLAFAPDWLQNIATFIPLTYGRHALEMAVFYSSSDLLRRFVVLVKSHDFVPFFFLLILQRGKRAPFTRHCRVQVDDKSVHENARFRMTQKRQRLCLGPHDLTAQGRHKRRQHTDDQDGA